MVRGQESTENCVDGLLHPSENRLAGWGGCSAFCFREGAGTHFSKLKRGNRMLFLMKMVKFSASIMTGLWVRARRPSLLGKRKGKQGVFPRGTTWSQPLRSPGLEGGGR